MTTITTEQEENQTDIQPEDANSHNVGQQPPSPEDADAEKKDMESQQEPTLTSEEIGTDKQQGPSSEMVNEDKLAKKVIKDVVARRLGLPLKSDAGDVRKLRTPMVQKNTPKMDVKVELASEEKRMEPRVAKRVLKFSGLAGRALAAVKATKTDEPNTKKSSTGLRMDEEMINMERRAQVIANKRKVAPKRTLTKSTRSKAPRVGGFGYGDGGETDESGDNANEKDEEDSEEEKEYQKPKPPVRPLAPVKKPLDARSRNILGKMLGHLNSAKRDLGKMQVVNDPEDDHWRPRRSPSHDLSVDSSEDSAQHSPAKRRKVDAHKGVGTEEEERIALQQRLEIHYSTMKNFIRTRTEPTIFFLPAKHNKKSLKELQDTRETIDHKIASLGAHLQGE